MWKEIENMIKSNKPCPKLLKMLERKMRSLEKKMLRFEIWSDIAS